MNTNKERVHRRPVDGDVRTQGVYSMFEVSTFRLYLLRAMYVFVVVGLAIFKLAPALLHPENLSPQDSVVVSVLGGFALLAVVGIRYPIQMLPLLFFEFVWKVIWVLAFGLPLLPSGGLDPTVSFGGTETLINCLLGIVLVPIVVPWGYVLEHYLKEPGDRWGGKQVTSSAPKQPGRNEGDATVFTNEMEGSPR
jgi:hypothetical protein